MDWYQLDTTQLDTPALLINFDQVVQNIEEAIEYAGGADRLRPHVKTHKTLEVAKLQRGAGIYKFKCATIPEAEMLAMARADDVLIAYQPGGPKINRVSLLCEKYPETKFSILIDNENSAKAVNEVFKFKRPIAYYFDINDGHNRTGIRPELVDELFRKIRYLPGLEIKGLHCYDGHIRMPGLEERVEASTSAFQEVIALRQRLEKVIDAPLTMVAGGSPSFSVHAKYHQVECSPGTFIFWDARYKGDYGELPFEIAAAVATRVISKIDSHTYCLDLGHKSIASEFPFPRVQFLTPHKLKQVGHSEEHLVLKSEQPDVLEVGQLIFGYPYHICPTVALYDHLQVVKDGKIATQWKVIARDRRITV